MSARLPSSAINWSPSWPTRTSGAERRELIRQKAAVEHEVPLLGRRRYTASCIHRWLLLYRKHGRAGLAPRARRDAGHSRAMSDTEAAVLLNYLENHPELTAAATLRKLQADGRITSYPSTSALSRLVRSAGLQRRERQRHLLGVEQKLKFDFFAPLECVQVDCMHALKLPDPIRKVDSRFLNHPSMSSLAYRLPAFSAERRLRELLRMRRS